MIWLNQAAARRRGAAGLGEREVTSGKVCGVEGAGKAGGVCLHPKRREESPRMRRRCAG